MNTTLRANLAAVLTRAAPTSGLSVAASRWGTAAAGTVATLLLAGYVHTVQASVLRGQSLRQAQRLADADRVAAAYLRRPALTAPARRPVVAAR